MNNPMKYILSALALAVTVAVYYFIISRSPMPPRPPITRQFILTGLLTVGAILGAAILLGLFIDASPIYYITVAACLTTSLIYRLKK
jgi:tellurite resistance protein TehA-like permease